MGRRKSGVWQNFSEITIDGEIRAKCDFCQMDLVSNPDRMQKHLDKCAANNTEKHEAGPSSMKQTKLSVTSFSTSKSMQHQIELQVTRYIVASNTAFLQVENKQFEKLFTMLRPGTKIPNRQKVSGPLLDELYGEEKSKVANFVSGCNATLVLDGWSTRSNDPIIGVSIITSSKVLLVNTVDTTGHPHTIDYLVELFREQVEICEKEWKVKITCLVTDNAANMSGLRRRVKSKEMLLHSYGCQAHLMNLLAKDIYQDQKVLIVVKHLRNHHEESAQMKNLNMPRPPLPCDTRWNSVADTLRYFHDQWSNIVLVINTTMKNTDQIYRFMEDVPLKRAVTNLLEIFKPIGIALDKLQSDTCTVGSVFQIWNEVCVGSPAEYAEKVAKRAKAALSPEILAANLLDHRYGGKDFNKVETASAIEYLNEIDNGIMRDVTNYMAKEPPYSENLFGESYSGVKPSVWWKTGRRIGFSDKLCEIAESLVGGIASSAGLERQFSTLGMTYGTLRTSLGPEKAGKLAFLYRELNCS